MGGSEITKKDILFSLATFLASVASFLVFYFTEYKKNKEKSEKSNENQSGEVRKINEKLFNEMEARKNLEKSIEEENTKIWKSFYQSAQERSDKYYKMLEEEKKQNGKLREKIWKERGEYDEEVRNLVKQLRREGVPDDKHAISDKRRRQQEILEVEIEWESNQKNGEINGKNITGILGESWKSDFNNKKGEEITRWKDWLIKKIHEEVKLAK